MAFTSIIAHRIFRTAPDAAVSLTLREHSFTLNGELEEIGYRLKSEFIRKGGKSYGRFSEDRANSPFSAWLTEYREQRLGFPSMTHKAMQHLQQTMEPTSASLDGYLFFIEEQLEAGQTFYIFFVEHNSGVYLDGDLVLADSFYLDLSQFTLAAKINCIDWDRSDSSTYLTLMRSRSDKDVADAFGIFTGFTDKQDLRTETREFLEAVESFSQTLEEPLARVTRSKVVDYCLEQNKAGRAVSLAELSETLATETKGYNPERFVKEIRDSKPTLKPEFIPHSGEVRSFVRISGRSDSLSMSFASECLGREIEYDADRDQLTIKNIPSSLRKQLLAHLKQLKE